MGEDAQEEEGTAFGRYRLLDLVGKGGMGQVYRAHDTETERIVAVKVLPPNMAKDDDFKDRFRREAYTAARLNEPHVVPIHHFGEIDGQLYLDMRFIDGRNLSAVIRDSGGRLPAPRAVAIIEQVAAALHAAHESGLVHRDVKPSNILVGDRDFAYLIDFGIVRATEEAGLTVPGQTLGTVSYMAPEQFTDGAADPRSDIYALTCVLFECLTGRVPFTGDTRQKADAHANAPVPRASDFAPGVPHELDAVIAHGMAKKAADRFPDAMAFANAARAAGTRRPPPRRPPPPPPPPPQHRPPDPAWATTQAAPLTRPRPQPPRQYGGTPPPPGPQYPPRHTTPPDFTSSPQPPWWRRNLVAVIFAAVALLLVIVIVAVIATSGDDSSASSEDTDSAGSAGDSAQSSSGYGRQEVLPFEALGQGRSVAVDPKGTVYAGVTSGILSVPKNGTRSDFVRFVDRFSPSWLIFDRRGAVLYMSDGFANRVATTTPGSDVPKELPFPGLNNPDGVALDSKDAVYVADTKNNRVMKLDPGAPAAVDMGIGGLTEPASVVINSKDQLYIGTKDKLLTVSAGTASAESVPDAPGNPYGLAVDADDNVYVADPTDATVSKFDADSGDWSELPFTDLERPVGVAVDGSGNVYVVDGNRVVRLSAI